MLGVLGGGQLGRMWSHAAQSLGFRTAVLDPDAHSPAGLVSHLHVCADYLDPQGLAQMAAQCQAITTEFENVPAQALRQLGQSLPCAPGADPVAVAQDRAREKAHFLACLHCERCEALRNKGARRRSAMSLNVAVDAVVLIAAVLGTWWGWGRGAARMIISTLATVAGLFLAAQGRAPISEVVSALLPDVDARLVSLLILIGAAWIFLGIAAWLLGNALRTLLQALRLGLIDSLVGAVLGLAQALLLCSAILFLLEATGTFLVPAPEPLGSLAVASAASQSAGLLHSIVYPFIWTLIGSSLPPELQQILRP